MLKFDVTLDRFKKELSTTSRDKIDFNWYVEQDIIHLFVTTSTSITYHCIISIYNIPMSISEKMSISNSVLGIYEEEEKEEPKNGLNLEINQVKL